MVGYIDCKLYGDKEWCKFLLGIGFVKINFLFLIGWVK